MTRQAQCGQRPPASGLQRYCPVCDALCGVDQEAPGALQRIDAIFDKLDRIHKIRAAYGRRR